MNALRCIAILLLVSSCATKVRYPDLPPPPASSLAGFDQIVVVGTNDFHGFLKPKTADVQGQKMVAGGAEWFAGYVRILEEKYGDRLILLDGGDIFQGTLESNHFLGKSTLEYYNLLPYRAAAVGNHEFDYGPRRKGDPDRLGAFKDLAKAARFPFVQANIFWKKNGKLWKEANLHPSVMVNAGGYKVGIIGLTTETTPAKTLPQNVVGLDFRLFTDVTLAEAKALREKGAEIVLVATHEGIEDKGSALRKLLAEVPPGTIDGVVAGHAHKEVHEFVNGVPVIESRTQGLFFGRFDLYVNRATRKLEPSLTRIHPMNPICSAWYKSVDGCDTRAVPADPLPFRPALYEGKPVAADQRVVEVLKPFFAKTEKLRREVLGHAKEDFDFYPSGESQMGYLFLRAFEERFPYAKVHFHNGGGLRRKLVKGPITYGDLYELHPFDNYAVALKMNGKQLKDLFRLGVSGANSLPFFLGVKAVYSDTDSPEFARDVNNDGKQEKWERNRLVSLTWEKSGQPVRDEEEFWLATNDYLASGGDNTAHVFGSIPPSRRRYLDLTSRDVVAEYLRKHRGLSLPAKDEPRLQKAN